VLEAYSFKTDYTRRVTQVSNKRIETWGPGYAEKLRDAVRAVGGVADVDFGLDAGFGLVALA